MFIKGKHEDMSTILYSNSSAIGVEWIDNRTSLLDPVVCVCHRDSHLIAPSRYIIFLAVSWPPIRSSSFWLDHECFALGSRWCHPLMCDHHLILFLLAVCSAGCTPPKFFVSDLVHSGLSCSFSETPRLCCCRITQT